MDINLSYFSISELAQGIRCGKLSPVEITEIFLNRIERLNPSLLAYTEVFPERAIREVEDAVRNTKDTFRALNIQVGHIEIPEVNEANAIPKRYLEMSVEAYSANKALLDEHVSDLDPIMEWMIDGKDISAPEYFLMMRKRSELKNSIYKTMSNIASILGYAPRQLFAALTRQL